MVWLDSSASIGKMVDFCEYGNEREISGSDVGKYEDDRLFECCTA
jgi:hypothetical protein